MHSDATTVSAYLESLPPERRKVVAAVRKTVKAAMPRGYEEVMQYGMISWVVPLSAYPEGYRGDKRTPIPYVSLASQKRHYALYMMGLYAVPGLEKRFLAAYEKTGKRIDMGKCCVRFRDIDDLPLGVIADAIAAVPVRTMISSYVTAITGAKKRR